MTEPQYAEDTSLPRPRDPREEAPYYLWFVVIPTAAFAFVCGGAVGVMIGYMLATGHIGI